MLLAALWLQVVPVGVTASVDRDRVSVGDEVVYSLRAVTAQRGTFRVELPRLAGLEILEQTERIEPVAGGDSAGRVYVLELTLRAAEVGTWRFGPVLILVGAVTEVAPEIVVTVAGTAQTEPSRNPRLLDLIRRVPPPNPGANATLAIVVSADRMFQGDQLDVLTAAWFPRSLRSRLRRPPTLKPPVLVGVWSVPQAPIPGLVASRLVGEETYDLFISHQIAYPLAAGRLTIPPARLEYAVPMTRRASGDERPVEALSDDIVLTIDAAPTSPSGHRGPQGRQLSLGYRIPSLPAYAGEVLPVEITLSGEGNLTFWPPPNVTWPAGTRAYLDRVGEAPQVQEGRLGGLKTFYFRLLADSVGSVALPPLSYDFFDPGSGVNRVATASGVVVPVLGRRSAGPPRAVPPLAVATADWPAASLRVAPLQPWWWVAVLTPAAVILLVTGYRRWPRSRGAPVSAPGGLAALERLVGALVPEVDRGHPERLEGSLRRAGVGSAAAREVARLKLDIDWGRFAPGGSVDEAALGRRAGELLGRLPGAVRRRASLGLLLLVAGGLASAQTEVSPEAHYRERAYRPAAAGFRARAEAEPDRWQHWYNAAAAEYLAGRDAAAAAALARARVLAPRSTEVRGLWETLERQYQPLREVPRSPFSRAEWALVTVAAWWLGAGLMLIRRVPRRVAVTLALVGCAAAIIPAAVRPWAPTGFAARTVQLLRSPHGLAPENGSLGALTPVTVASHRAGWELVVDRQGNRGWVPATAVATVTP